MKAWKCTVCKHKVTNHEYITYHSDAACRVCGSAVMESYEEIQITETQKLERVTMGVDSSFTSIAFLIDGQYYMTTFKEGSSAKQVADQLEALAKKIREPNVEPKQPTPIINQEK